MLHIEVMSTTSPNIEKGAIDSLEVEYDTMAVSEGVALPSIDFGYLGDFRK